ncbi:MAG: FHA domain-containing protein [Myxococcaceae bacterium]
MAVRLNVRQRSEAGGAENGRELILDEDVITLGRDTACQVVLAQMAVSRNHARITRDGTLFFIEDLGSAYGTKVSGNSLPRGEKRLLRNGDTIAIAQFDVTFDRVADAAQAGKPDKTAFIARNVVKDVMRGLGSGEGPCFRVMNGPREGQRIEIANAQELIFGREEGVDVVLQDDLVSRRHAKVRRDWSGTHVEDLESRNGIKVNRKRVKRKTLRDRDELEIGGIRLLYLDPSEVREAPVVLADDEDLDGNDETVHPDAVPSKEHVVGEPEPEEQAAPEPEPEPEPEPQADAELQEEPELSEEQYPEDEPGPAVEKHHRGENILLVVKDVRRLVPIALMGVVALGAVALIIALVAGV